MHNEIIKGKTSNYYISYNPETFDEGLKETAIVVKGDHKLNFYILYGDWTKEYKEANKEGLDACLEIFKANLDRIGYTSDTLEDA